MLSVQNQSKIIYLKEKNTVLVSKQIDSWAVLVPKFWTKTNPVPKPLTFEHI